MQCEICQKEIIEWRDKKNKHKFCSKECYLVFHKAKPFIKRSCANCNKEFSVRKKTTKYCSKSCASKKNGYQLGHKLSFESLEKMSKTKTKIQLQLANCKRCGKLFSFKSSESNGIFCSKKCVDKYGPRTGIPPSEEARKRLSKKYKGSGNPYWKGGVSFKKRRTQEYRKYREWHKTILERDDYICVLCGSDKDIEVDHIKPFALFPKLMLELSNGQVLCKKCHKKKTSKERKKYWKNQFSQSEFFNCQSKNHDQCD